MNLIEKLYDNEFLNTDLSYDEYIAFLQSEYGQTLFDEYNKRSNK